jgi:hypothetical protein
MPLYLFLSVEFLLEAALPLKALDPEAMPSVLKNEADFLKLLTVDE